MKLSMKFLYLQLKNKYCNLRLELPGDTNVYFTNIHIMQDIYWVALEDILYLVDCPLQKLNDSNLPLNGCYIVIDDVKEIKSKYACLCFPSKNDKIQIFDDLMSIFYRYDKWSKDVAEAVIRQESLDNILKITSSIEFNPMYFADKSFKMLASISMDMGDISIIWKYQLKYGYLPFNVMMDLTETGEINLLNNAKEAFYAVTKSFTAHFVSKSIHYKNEVQGYFFIIEAYRKLNQCDIEIAEYLGNLISSASHGKNNYLQNSILYHEHFMIDVMEGTLTDGRVICNQLSAIGWKLYGEYRIFGVFVNDDVEALKRNLLIVLTDGWHAEGFMYKDLLLVVYYETLDKYEILLKELKKILQLFSRKGVLSEVFSCFSNLGQYYKQIQIVLQESNQDNGQFMLYEDFYLKHRNRLLITEIPIYRPVEMLWEYDKTHGCEYCNTLYQYLLHERNTVQTAKTLFLHRNTMKYRLEKIEDIIQVSLEKMEVRQRIFDSLYIYLNI